MTGDSPLVLDSAPPKLELSKYTANETRFRVVEQMDPERYKTLMGRAQHDLATRFSVYEQLSKLAFPVTKR